MRTTYLAAVAIAVTALPAPAADLFGDRLRVNGFASQAYLKSSDNVYLVEGSPDGSFQLTELGLTINAQVTDKLRVGGQLLARDFGDEGNHAVKLDWGFGEYRLDDWVGIRLGKVKLPIGLYNEERDLDFLRPMVFLPQSIYDETMRDFLTAGVGGGVFGNLDLAAGGDLDYAAFVGEIDVSGDTALLQREKRFISGAAMENFGTPLTDYDFRSETLFAARLIYNTPFGLRLGASYFDLRGHFEVGAFGASLSDLLAGTGIPATVTTDLRHNWILSAEYVSRWVDLRAEYRIFELTSATFGRLTEDEREQQGWYAMATARIPGAEKVSVSLLYDDFDRDRRFDEERFDKKDLGVGVRVDVTRGFALKGEWHDVEGTGAIFDTWGSANPQGLEESWNYFIVKASFAF